MKRLIKGIHHAAIKCCGEEQFRRCVAFYRDTLGLTVLRSWGEGTGSGAMIDTGSGIIEIFANAPEALPKGVWPHIALATDDVDECIAVVREAGYPVMVEPKDIVIASEPPFPARIAFCKGAAGEDIEFFCEK